MAGTNFLQIRDGMHDLTVPTFQQLLLGVVAQQVWWKSDLRETEVERVSEPRPDAMKVATEL